VSHRSTRRRRALAGRGPLVLAACLVVTALPVAGMVTLGLDRDQARDDLTASVPVTPSVASHGASRGGTADLTRVSRSARREAVPRGKWPPKLPKKAIQVAPPPPEQIRMVQANIKSGIEGGAWAHDFGIVMGSHPDFVTLNEMAPRSDAQITPAGYASYRSMDSAFTAETPVLWRTDRWELVDTGTRYLTLKRVTWGVRAVNWATLRSKASGRVVTVISAHAPPDGAQRSELLPIFMSGLARLVNELDDHGAVLVGGDLNAGERDQHRWPGAAVNSADLASTWSYFGQPRGGTHDGGSTIDYVLFQRDNGLAPTGDGTMMLNSDHRGVSAVFTLG
jgi:hypothetical protein